MIVDADSVRQAIARGEYAEAQRLWERYAGALREQIEAGMLDARQWAECGSLVEWSREVASCARAHALDQLNGIHVAGLYGSAPRQRQAMIRASF